MVKNITNNSHAEILYLAKTAWRKEQIIEKKKKGAKYFEIQLLDPKNEQLLDAQYLQSKDFHKIVKENDFKVIHMPLFNGSDTEIETELARELFMDVCHAADCISKINNDGTKTIIVVHLRTSIEQLSRLGLLEQIKKNLIAAIDRFSDIEIAIENTGLFTYSDPFSYVELAKLCNHPRIGTCLDTCHAMITVAFTELMKKNFFIQSIDLEQFFTESANSCKLIHLAGAKNLGQGYGNEKGHGTIFERTPEDEAMLNSIVSYYKKYGYTCPITLEVREDDLLDCKNFEHMLQMSNRVFNL